MNQQLLNDSYLVIPNFISDERARHLANDFRQFADDKELPGDHQAPNSHAVYNHISFLELLCEKTPEVSRLIEETVLPTYSYARVYGSGSTLEKHIDRPACEISLTLHLDGDKSWPIWIETPDNEKKFVDLNPGDAMLYLGTIAPHWREEYTGNYYSQVFLHYVQSRGDCSFAYFDNREGKIGAPDKEPDVGEKIIEKATPVVSEEPKVEETGSSSIRKLDDFIKVYDNIISKDLCEKILKEYKNCDLWTPTSVGAEGIVDAEQRNCSYVSLSSPENIDQNFEIRKFIDVEFHQQLIKVVEKYSDEFPEFCPTIDTGYDLLRYKTGQFYKQHTDSFHEQQRSISCSICINDEYEGGEFAFFDREVMVRGGVGSVIVFPSNFMFPHEVMPVTAGTRYSIVTWYV